MTEWIKWEGGNNPAGDKLVHVEFRYYGDKSRNPVPANYLCWKHVDSILDIIAYKYAEEEKDMQNNSWYNKGELPPVGTICEAWFAGDGWLEVEILKHGKRDTCACYLTKNLIGGGNLKWSNNFRPIISEREKAIEEMMELINSRPDIDNERDMCGMFYDAGFKKTYTGGN